MASSLDSAKLRFRRGSSSLKEHFAYSGVPSGKHHTKFLLLDKTLIEQHIIFDVLHVLP